MGADPRLGPRLFIRRRPRRALWMANARTVEHLQAGRSWPRVVGVLMAEEVVNRVDDVRPAVGLCERSDGD